MPDDFLSQDLALSVLFGYDGLSIQLLEQAVVEGAALASEDTGPLDGTPGFWFELRDDAGQVVWRHEAPWPFAFEREVPHGEFGEDPGWIPDPVPSGAFAALVPVDPIGHLLVLVATPPPGLDVGPLTDLAVFDVGVNA